jgi:hypothetical protein
MVFFINYFTFFFNWNVSQANKAERKHSEFHLFLSFDTCDFYTSLFIHRTVNQEKKKERNLKFHLYLLKYILRNLYRFS